MDLSVQNVYGLLLRSRLLPLEDARAMLERWQKEAKDPADVEQFTKWMVSKQYVTEYQAALLVHGYADHFFLDQYKLLERIGKGRMAVVYQAVHQLGQVVAIKILPPSKARDPQVLARFQREARLAWRLNHPNVVHTFQAGEADGLHFLVMEYLDGETLEEVLKRRGRLPVEEAVRLITQALSGLQHLHERGLVHRNLEPANLMLVPRGQAGRADSTAEATLKILDVSLSRAVFDAGSPGTANLLRLTHYGTLLGNGDYLSPEQARDPHQADIRADIYSLGCILYHALAGKPPFSDTNPIRQVIRTVTETPRLLREFNPAVPDGLQEIVSRMMAKDPAQRYRTPDDAAQALQVFLAGRVDPPRPPAQPPHLAAYVKWVEENQRTGESPAPASVGAVARASTPAAPGPIPYAASPALAASVPPVACLAPVRSGATPSVVPLALPVYSVQPTANGYATAPVRERATSSEEGFNPTRRDYLAMILGAGGLLVAEGLGWGLARLLRPKDQVSRAPEGESARKNAAAKR